MKLRAIDLHRWLFGEVPWTFTFEVIVRIAVILGLLLLSMRLLGKRMASTATRNEIAALVSLAGGVGPAMQDGKMGLLPPIVVAVVVVGTARLVMLLSLRNGTIEQLTQGTQTALVQDGTIDLDGLKHAALSRLRLTERLRSAEIRNLGAVSRVFLEINGAFTIVKSTNPRPGLSLIPPLDTELRASQKKHAMKLVCSRCGDPVEHARCESCGSVDREPAVED